MTALAIEEMAEEYYGDLYSTDHYETQCLAAADEFRTIGYSHDEEIYEKYGRKPDGFLNLLSW